MTPTEVESGSGGLILGSFGPPLRRKPRLRPFSPRRRGRTQTPDRSSDILDPPPLLDATYDFDLSRGRVGRRERFIYELPKPLSEMVRFGNDLYTSAADGRFSPKNGNRSFASGNGNDRRVSLGDLFKRPKVAIHISHLSDGRKVFLFQYCAIQIGLDTET